MLLLLTAVILSLRRLRWSYHALSIGMNRMFGEIGQPVSFLKRGGLVVLLPGKAFFQ